MAASGRAILQAHMDGLLAESIPLDFQWTLSSGILEILPAGLIAGDNAVGVPSGTDLIIMVPPVTNAGTLMWSKTGGTTNAIQQPSNAPNIIAWSAGAVVVNSSVPIPLVYFYFVG